MCYINRFFVISKGTVWILSEFSSSVVLHCDREHVVLQGGLALFVQVMPILILVIVSALSQMMVTNPPYSLSFRP